MFSKLRSRRPSHATVVAYVALFVALGGTSAYAANEWTGDNIVDESLTSDDLANDKAVQGSDVIDESLESVDLKNGTGVQGIDVVDGSLAAADLATFAVTNSKLLTNAVTASKINTDAVGASEIAADAVGASEIFKESVRASEIAAGAVGSSEVADKSLGTAEFASSIPAARITRTGTQGINNLTPTTVNFNSEDYDTASMHSTSSNLSRLTAPVTGIYEVSAHIDWDINGFGYRSVCLRRNGLSPPCLARDVASGSATSGDVILNASTVERLTAGEYVDISVYQSSGGLRSFTPEASMTWLAPGP